jgi:hypothetical protein
MAAYFFTNAPSDLLVSFKKKIDSRHITTWLYDAEGDFTHTCDAWKNLAWFRPSIQSDCLIFNILRTPQSQIPTNVYALYHSRLIETFLLHFSHLFQVGEATASPADGDST